MHLWKGLRITDAPMTAADINFTSKNGGFRAGLWAGAGFNEYYSEFDYYVSYTYDGFSISIWDINNTSDFPDAQIFNYDIGETSHFIDITVGYEFSKITLKLSWNTIVQGHDAGNLDNAFSNYLEASFAVIQRKDCSLSAYVGGAFSFANEAHFYGDHPNVTNMGVIYAKQVKVLKNYTLPVSARLCGIPSKSMAPFRWREPFFELVVFSEDIDKSLDFFEFL